MEIKKIETKGQLKELFDCSAMTWEGLSPTDFSKALEMCSTDGVGYLLSGATMNKICHLTGSNAYPDNLNIFCIKNFKGLAMFVGARWMDDIIDNNAMREHYHPFR